MLSIMPICIHCGQPTPYLYTVYQSAYNFRLEQCVNCPSHSRNRNYAELLGL